MDPSEAKTLADRLTSGWVDYLARQGRNPSPRTLPPTERIAFDLLVGLFIATLQDSQQPKPPSGAKSKSTPAQQRHGLEGIIFDHLERMQSYEDPLLHDLALECMPIGTLYERASESQSSSEQLPCWEDALADALVKWFKQDFFKWADPIPCPTCGGKTQMKGMGIPNDEEKRGGAGRVELHECVEQTGCAGLFRFPRYNDPKVLMKTRLGRCGEWANLFCLFIRAVGLRARYVWNAEDHVWNEYYSPAQKRWIHLDSCEAARDQPLLYDRGWGKKMSYVFAFSKEGAQDVTPGYVQDWEETLKRRRKGSEEELARVMERATRQQRLGLSEQELDRLAEEDANETRWLSEALSRAKQPNPLIDGEGRQSGTKEWKEARGEDGVSKDP